MYRILSYVSRLEAFSYLVLLVATAFKYGAEYETGVTLVGPIHGVLYLIYVAAILRWFTAVSYTHLRAHAT